MPPRLFSVSTMLLTTGALLLGLLLTTLIYQSAVPPTPSAALSAGVGKARRR